jgi:hypothetical protein
MRKAMKGIVIIMALGFLTGLLSACGSREIKELSKKDVLVSLKEDFGIGVETVFIEFRVTHSNDLKMLYFNEISEKLAASGDFRDGLNVLYIKTDEGEHKFVYYTPRLINRGGMIVSVKDGIYITDYPFNYTIDELYEQVLLIDNVDLRDSIKGDFYDKFSNFASFYSIAHNDRVAHVHGDKYVFVFNTKPETLMIFLDNELYIVKEQQCVYPRKMSIAQMIILFDGK